MRTRLLIWCLLQGCLVPVTEAPLDGGAGGDAGTPVDAGVPGAWQALSCAGFDGGVREHWCTELPGNLRRCADAELVGCSSLAQQLMVADGYLVWLSFDYPNRISHIWSRRLDGSAPVELASGPEAYPLAVGGGFAWWAEIGSSGTIRRAPLGGGPPETFATGVRNPRSLAANASQVFWSADEGIWRGTTPGAAPVLMVPNVFQPQGLVVDATSLYWGEANSGKIGRVPLAGGLVTTLTTATTTPWQLGLADGYVYWSGDAAPAPISRAPISGGPAEILAANQDVPRDMVVDSQGLYWVEQGGNFGMPVRIHSARPDGTSAASFLTPEQGGRIAIDARYLYFGIGNIYRVVR